MYIFGHDLVLRHPCEERPKEAPKATKTLACVTDIGRNYYLLQHNGSQMEQSCSPENMMPKDHSDRAYKEFTAVQSA